MRYDDVILTDKDYPDAHDIEKFGHDSPADYDPLTIGYVGDYRPPFWTIKRIVFLIVALLIVVALVLPALLGVF